MIGRRVGSVGEIERPGDYCGPVGEYFHGFLDEGHVWREC
jgi:hypothetical protein